ncbi:cyclic peptide export ABC transporter [Thalassomonas sp. RHCl1]|uniref:cyclic peptide export ABC transporter n=1 Tax=Thalassomonas sp. RHCl1 TaxID=2995320 RepID=UPI00248D172E|nr:cyclic peptide export ABC transporter [Thalassomonas sp. RHCl1]
MKLFDAFIEKAPNRLFISVILGALAGISYALMIPLVLSALQEEEAQFKLVQQPPEMLLGFEIAQAPFAQMFLFLCAFILTARTLSQVILTRVSMDVTTELRIKMYNRIARAPILALEKMGSAKLIATLTTDVPRIVMGARILPDILVNMVTLAGMLSYLWYLSSDIFWFVVQCIFWGMVTYQLPTWWGRSYFKKSRVHVDKLHGAIHGLINGAKELKLNQLKREDFFKEELIKEEYQVLGYDKKGHTIVRVAINYSDLISFFVIGAVSFIFVNYNAISSQDLIGVIMVLLYITGPIAIILGYFPQLSVARVSLGRVNKLFRDLPEEQVNRAQTSIKNWQQLHLKDVVYTYSKQPGSFAVGPLNLTINRGEITFIIGGNGSGKSTLSKLITQHYVPSSGEICFDDVKVNESTLNAVRQCIGAIYSDYHLFERLLGAEQQGVKETVERYLLALGLENKVTFDDGRFSTLSLSDGQKRRLALLVACIEDKDLYLFDEWAADQDPTFKDIFYRNILPELRAQGKAVVVISHDDRYFDLADQLVVMNEGQIVKDIGQDHQKLLETYVSKATANAKQVFAEEKLSI